MKDKPLFVALVPMRAGSERIKDKNLRSFAGRPLYHYIVSTLLEVAGISQIVIDTDSEEIQQEASSLSDRITILKRPQHLRAGTVPMNDVLLHDVQQVPADYYLQTHSTNPLLRPETIEDAIQAFLSALPAYDSLFSVTRLYSRLWRPGPEAVNHDPDVLLRTQDLPPIFEENSNLFIFNGETLKVRHNRIGYRPMLFEMDREEAWDIDEMLDFKIAEFIYLRRRNEGEL